MSELKEYVTQIQDQSNVHISEDAIFTVCAMAAVEVEGVAGLSHIGSDVASAKKNLSKAVRVRGVEGGVAVDVSIQVRFGSNIQDVAKAVQEAVRASVTDIIGLTPSSVNVYVSSISLED
ncbi:MAG: Asp23/Gls24 family envelope stress response protein [Oscillospiraceae bacterium]|nr:Asp23/Gls24 family envelope stress response protein [Oscillospiraceae bacterium]